MEKIILLGEDNRLSIKATKWFSIILGSVWVLLGLVNILRAFPINGLRDVLWIVTILAGVFAIFYGLTAFSKKSKYSMRLKVDDIHIEFKSTYLRPVTRVNWDDIKGIKFDAYKIEFNLNKRKEVFNYRSNREVSMEIKKVLRQGADERGIPVSGG